MAEASSPDHRLSDLQAQPILPPELFPSIVSLLRFDRPTLLSCSLVNRFFHTIAEQELASCLQISHRADVPLALRDHPSLSQYIHCLTLDMLALDTEARSPVLTGLKNLRILHLTAFPGYSVGPQDPIWLRDMLPGVTTLKISRLYLPVALLFCSPNLRHLKLHRVNFLYDPQFGDGSSPIVTNSLTLDSLTLTKISWNSHFRRLCEDPQFNVKSSLTCKLGHWGDIQYNLPIGMAEMHRSLESICSRNRNTLREVTISAAFSIMISAVFPSIFSQLTQYRIPITSEDRWNQNDAAGLCSDLTKSSRPLQLFVDTDHLEDGLQHVCEPFRKQHFRVSNAAWKTFDEGFQKVIGHRPLSVTFTTTTWDEDAEECTECFSWWVKIIKESLLPNTSASGIMHFELRAKKTYSCR